MFKLWSIILIFIVSCLCSTHKKTTSIFEYTNPCPDPEVRHSNTEESVLSFIRMTNNIYNLVNFVEIRVFSQTNNPVQMEAVERLFDALWSAFLWRIFMVHFYDALLWRIFMTHFYGAFYLQV